MNYDDVFRVFESFQTLKNDNWTFYFILITYDQFILHMISQKFNQSKNIF